jgi:hypothetical protein
MRRRTFKAHPVEDEIIDTEISNLDFSLSMLDKIEFISGRPGGRSRAASRPKQCNLPVLGRRSHLHDVQQKQVLRLRPRRI